MGKCYSSSLFFSYYFVLSFFLLYFFLFQTRISATVTYILFLQLIEIVKSLQILAQQYKKFSHNMGELRRNLIKQYSILLEEQSHFFIHNIFN